MSPFLLSEFSKPLQPSKDALLSSDRLPSPLKGHSTIWSLRDSQQGTWANAFSGLSPLTADSSGKQPPLDTVSLAQEMNELAIKMTVAAPPTQKSQTIPIPQFTFGNTNPDTTTFQFISPAEPEKKKEEETPPPFLTPQERFKELASLQTGGAFLIATFQDSSTSPHEEPEPAREEESSDDESNKKLPAIQQEPTLNEGPFYIIGIGPMGFPMDGTPVSRTDLAIPQHVASHGMSGFQVPSKSVTPLLASLHPATNVKENHFNLLDANQDSMIASLRGDKVLSFPIAYTEFGTDINPSSPWYPLVARHINGSIEPRFTI